VASYLVLFVLLFVVSAYAVLQLGQVEGVIRSVILTDFHLLDLQKKITDALLSESRYEKKYIIIRDKALFDGFLRQSTDVERFLAEAKNVADSPALRAVFEGLSDNHRTFKETLIEEAGFLSEGRDYPHHEYRSKKESLLNTMLERLKTVRAERQQDILTEIVNLGETGSRARKFAIGITAVFLLLGILLSIMITRSITAPLSIMKKKTAEIAQGNFEGALELREPPEIGDLAQALNVMSRRLGEVDRMKSDFFALMSHELRTPLTSIKEGTNLLLDGLAGATTEKQRRLLSIISEESNRLIDLVSALLDLSKMEAGMLAYNFTRVDMAPLVEKAVTEVLPLAAAKSVWIEREFSDLPPITADEERILQVMRNLLANAINFSPENSIVSITGQHRDDTVSIAITDQGPGIAPEYLETIFDKFKQATLTRSHKLRGTGLGLAVVKHIITAHGGKVWAESTVGTGSTFTFSLPV